MTTPTVLNQGFTLREDASLKAHLQGITVPVSMKQRQEDPQSFLDADRDDGPATGPKIKAVPVYFRLPENEVRRKSYPYITIDFLGPVRAAEREHRGVADYGRPDDPNAWMPDGVPAGGGRVELPIPVDLHYQITTFARFNQHDRIINNELFARRLEPRFGALAMVATDDAPDDMSLRRLDLLSGPNNGDVRDAQSKRVFRKMYTVSVSSELFHSDFAALAAVGRVAIDVDHVVLDVMPIE